MAELFRAAPPPPHRDALRITGRHVTPCTDELLVTIEHAMQRHSVVLSRPAVRELHAALGRWLDEGWPGVAHTDTPQVGAA
jgi:hypothetical protein